MVERQWTESGRLWVFFYRARKLRGLTTISDTMQQMASDINKIRRSLSINAPLSPENANTSCRRPVANGLQKLAQPSGSVQELQHRMRNPSGWNRQMVLQRKHLRWLERERITFVDLWKTWVLKISTVVLLRSSSLLHHVAGSGKTILL